MKRDRNYLKELRKIDKMNDFIFLENCNLKKENKRLNDYSISLADKNIDLVQIKDKIRYEKNEYLKKLIETSCELNQANEFIKKISSDSAKQKTILENEINLRDIETGNEKIKRINLEKENTELVKLLKCWKRSYFLMLIWFIILIIIWR